MKTVAVSVTEFAVPSPLVGSIESLSGLGRGEQKGLELHQRIQARRINEDPSYRAEVVTSHEFERENYRFVISGRMDGFYEGAVPRIEEIKSNFNLYELMKRMKEQRDQHPYCLQLQTYGYFHYLKTGTIPELTLHLVSSRDEESLDFQIDLRLPVYEMWLERRLKELEHEAHLAEKRVKRRKTAALMMKFPFENPRPGQTELIDTIEKGMVSRDPLLIQAPTGLGKTVGVMYPTLRDALERGQRLVYLTPKNSQHAVAEDAVERLQNTGANIKAMTLTAKSKMCFKNEPICNPDYCEFAKDHYTKLAQHQVLDKLAKKKSLTAKVFTKMAAEFEVCPFEIQIDAAQEADAVICDYNYVFAPRSALGRVGGLELDQKGKPNLVIDEAHNLPSRTMDYYSPELSSVALENMREDVDLLAEKYRVKVNALINSCLTVVSSCAPPGATEPCEIDPPVPAFLLQDAELREFLSGYLKSDVHIEPGDVAMRLCYYWGEFTEALQFVASDRQEFFTTYDPRTKKIKITCCDASEMLKSAYDKFEQVVGFSATLKPFEFYGQLGGLANRGLKTSEFQSPFPKERRKLLIIPQISSKYSERERNYPRIAETIQKIAALKRGNYFAFFPSFDFLYRVAQQFVTPEGFTLIKQERSMSRAAVDNVIGLLRDRSAAHIIMAVQGGVFSEGVDYPGDMVIGAFVIGPPLPTFDLEREKMRAYYEDHYSAGFDYAYTYPAMAKAVQAAGRVIRSETDRGIIVLMDNRFIQPSYAKSMPGDWFEESPRELTSQSILSDIADFWAKIDDLPS